MPSFTVVLPTYNRCEIVEETLRRLVAQDYPKDRYEILVVDNSSDETPDMVERLSADSPVALRVMRDSHRLPAVKRNEALDAAACELILYVNDDLWVGPDFLTEHARTHLAHDGQIAVLGHCRQSPQMEQTPFIEFYEPFAYHLIDERSGGPLGYRFFWSMNISLPVAVMRERNFRFHEDWREIGHEDLELGWRWTQAGYSIYYNERATGEHFHPHTLESACRLQASIGRGIVDLEQLVPDPMLHENYGVFRWSNSPKSVARGLARRALFNSATVPLAQRYLESRARNDNLSRRMYWKILLHHTNKGYRSQPSRSLSPVPTWPLREPSLAPTSSTRVDGAAESTGAVS
jgi:glycosyltransferase involved in cell wall biosynthesis